VASLTEDEPVGSLKMHANEVDTDVALVRRLLAGQFPQWADLPIEPVPAPAPTSLGQEPAKTAISSAGMPKLICPLLCSVSANVVPPSISTDGRG
jgi:hypothetical protein